MTVTSPWNPPDHWPATVYLTEQAPAGGGLVGAAVVVVGTGVVVLGVGVGVVGLGVGVVVVVGVGVSVSLVSP
jgi:hypothetical protein